MEPNLTREETALVVRADQRRYWKRWRDELPASRRLQANAALSDQLHEALLVWLTDRREQGLTSAPLIAVYWPIQSEPNLIALWHRWQSMTPSVRLALPVMQGNQMPLLFALWTKGHALGKDRIGAMIPDPLQPLRPDLVLAPCLAYKPTKLGTLRLGYGGGYYDRSFSSLNASGTRVVSWAVAYEGCLEVGLEANATDLVFDRLFTQ